MLAPCPRILVLAALRSDPQTMLFSIFPQSQHQIPLDVDGATQARKMALSARVLLPPVDANRCRALVNLVIRRVMVPQEIADLKECDLHHPAIKRCSLTTHEHVPLPRAGQAQQFQQLLQMMWADWRNYPRRCAPDRWNRFEEASKIPTLPQRKGVPERPHAFPKFPPPWTTPALSVAFLFSFILYI